ncbi:CutA1 divalent ion tolerance protein [Halopenitus malekzadehii]|uniref:CutA1 divalent ion tolerance protein n=1 Tax=Halopenitus malekzadehii TaxID=1267564 RepID=A0A1H6IK10_9EURY|nr:CutA1 divalent ion tolerance protein [Halopenitus malekzadehii]
MTVPRDHAKRIAETVVAERLAACVNRVPCRSTYRWDGDVVTDEETPDVDGRVGDDEGPYAVAVPASSVPYETTRNPFPRSAASMR